jgi:hypothetical protein
MKDEENRKMKEKLWRGRCHEAVTAEL